MKDDIKRAIDRLTPSDAQRERMLQKILEEKAAKKRPSFWKPMALIAAAVILLALVPQLPKWFFSGSKSEVPEAAVAENSNLMKAEDEAVPKEAEKKAEKELEVFFPLGQDPPKTLPIFSLPLLEGQIEKEEKLRQSLIEILRDMEKKLGLKEAKISESALDMRLNYEDGSFIHLSPKLLEIRKPTKDMDRAAMLSRWQQWLGWKSVEILKQDEKSLWLISRYADSKEKILMQLKELTELKQEGDFFVLRRRLPFYLDESGEVSVISPQEAMEQLGKKLPWNILYREKEGRMLPYYRFYDEGASKDYWIPASREGLQ